MASGVSRIKTGQTADLSLKAKDHNVAMKGVHGQPGTNPDY
jgi:hypothetical protein